MEAERWKRHRKEPSCVVGEQTQWPLGQVEVDDTDPQPPFSLFGDMETLIRLSLLSPSDWPDWEAIIHECFYLK